MSLMTTTLGQFAGSDSQGGESSHPIDDEPQYENTSTIPSPIGSCIEDASLIVFEVISAPPWESTTCRESASELFRKANEMKL